MPVSIPVFTSMITCVRAPSKRAPYTIARQSNLATHRRINALHECPRRVGNLYHRVMAIRIVAITMVVFDTEQLSVNCLVFIPQHRRLPSPYPCRRSRRCHHRNYTNEL